MESLVVPAPRGAGAILAAAPLAEGAEKTRSGQVNRDRAE